MHVLNGRSFQECHLPIYSSGVRGRDIPGVRFSKNFQSISTDIVYMAVSAVKLCVRCQSSKQYVKLNMTVAQHKRSTPTQTLYGHCTGQLVLADTPS